MATVADMEAVKRAHARNASAHRKAHEDALRLAAIKRAEEDASPPPSVPQMGLQGDEEGFWEVGEE